MTVGCSIDDPNKKTIILIYAGTSKQLTRILKVMTVPLFLFEVMDKEPSLLFIWSFFLVAAVGGFLLVRLTPFLLPVILLIVVGYASLY